MKREVRKYEICRQVERIVSPILILGITFDLIYSFLGAFIVLPGSDSWWPILFYVAFAVIEFYYHLLGSRVRNYKK